jgi:hypothetical protein
MESTTETTLPSLETVFKSFCSTGKSEMSNKEYAKVNKDCHLLDKKYNTTDVDINFAKIKTKTSKTITFTQFKAGLELAAIKKGIDYDAIVEAVCKAGGPTFVGTKADYVKFHDDKSLFTGVYANGGPSTVDSQDGKVSDISGLCDRTSADVRGVKK